jgi:hypothetical protein
VIVRDCSSFGLPDYIRVRVHDRVSTDRLIRGVCAWQQGC